MAVHQSKNKSLDIDKASTNSVVSQRESISRHRSRSRQRSSSSKSPSPSDRSINLSKLKDKDAKCHDKAGDEATSSTSKQRHIDLSYMDVEDKVDALDGIAAIASRYASKRSHDALISNSNKNEKEKNNKDDCSTIQKSKNSKTPAKNTIKCKSTNNQQNNYRLSNEKFNRSVNGFRDFYSSDKNYRESSPSVGPKSFGDIREKNSWKLPSHNTDVSPFEGPSSWDDLRSDIPPPRKKYLSPLSTFSRIKYSAKDLKSLDGDIRSLNLPSKRRCSSLAPSQKKICRLPEEPRYWDDLGSYNVFSSRGNYTSKNTLGKHVSRDGSVPRDLLSVSVVTCHICKKYFKTKSIFMKHLKFCDAYRTCTVCNTVMKTQANLKKHLMKTGHVNSTDSLQEWIPISIKKFKALFNNREFVEETEIFPEREISEKAGKKIQKDKFMNEYTVECSRESIYSHGNEDDSENKEKNTNLDNDKNENEIEKSLTDVPRNSVVDESYFEEKEERYCLDGLGAIFSQYLGNSTSKVSKKKQILENDSHENCTMEDKVVEQETIRKHPKRATAKDFFVDGDPCLDVRNVRNYKKRENKTKAIDNDQNNSDHFNNTQNAIDQDCEIDYNENNDSEKANNPCEGVDREFDTCIEEYNSNEYVDESENIDENCPVFSSTHDDGQLFVSNADISDIDTNEQNSQIESSEDNSSENFSFITEVDENKKEDFINVIRNSDDEIIEVIEVIDDSSDGSIFEIDERESNLENITENSNSKIDFSCVIKERETLKSVNDKYNSESNPLSTKKIKGDCEMVMQNYSSEDNDSRSSIIFETEKLESNVGNISESSNNEGNISYVANERKILKSVNYRNNSEINPLSIEKIKGDCEIVMQNCSSEVIDDDSRTSSIFENEKLENNFENIIENNNSAENISFIGESMKTIDNENNKTNSLSAEQIREDSDFSEGEETTLIAYSNSKNPILNKIKGPDIIKCENKGSTTIVEVTHLEREVCPNCSQQFDITKVVFNVKTGKLSFCCAFCSLLLITQVQSKNCSKKQKKGNSSKLNVRTKTNKLGNKNKNDKSKENHKINCLSEDNSLKTITNENNKNTKKVKNKNKNIQNSSKTVKKRKLHFVRRSTRSQKKYVDVK